MLYQKNREIYKRYTGKEAPRPNVGEPSVPPNTGDPEIDNFNRAMYKSLCEFYKGLTGHYPENYVPRIR